MKMATIEAPDRTIGATNLTRHPAESADTNTPAIKIWAGIGAATIAFFAYIIIAWVTGDYFKSVPQGPSDTPTWMHVELIAWQVVSIPAALGLIYWFVVRPWRRERTVGIDGLLLIGGATLWVQDPWSSAVNHWFVYNTDMVNMGSWANNLPWFNAFGEPGAMTSEPILFTPAAYVYIMLIGAAIGCWAMRKARGRYPAMGSATLVGVCFVVMCLFDVVLEGIIWLPLGVFEYPGGHWNLFPDSYHPYPLNEMLTIGAVFTALASLRFFRDDRGHTVVERGVHKLAASPRKSVALRALAVVAFMNVAMLAFYNVPNTMIGANSREWPAAVQERSYFTNGLCGDGTDRACPGGSNPTIKSDSAYPNTNGGVTTPKGERPVKGAIVPFDRGKPGGGE
jgi:hypothetical protein